MIEAIEVHEGSWVKTTNDAIFNDEWKNRCCPLSKDDMIHIITYGCEERYVGIELTSELLEKCGFVGESPVNSSNISSYRLGSVGIALPNYHYKSGFYYFNSGIQNPVIEIKYLHQLQHLFFALTGNKLEVNF